MRTWPITFHGEKVVENKGLLTSAQHLPFDSNTCEVNLMANGKSLGTTGSKAFSAKLPRSNKTILKSFTFQLPEGGNKTRKCTN